MPEGKREARGAGHKPAPSGTVNVVGGFCTRMAPLRLPVKEPKQGRPHQGAALHVTRSSAAGGVLHQLCWNPLGRP